MHMCMCICSMIVNLERTSKNKLVISASILLVTCILIIGVGEHFYYMEAVCNIMTATVLAPQRYRNGTATVPRRYRNGTVMLRYRCGTDAVPSRYRCGTCRCTQRHMLRQFCAYRELTRYRAGTSRYRAVPARY